MLGQYGMQGSFVTTALLNKKLPTGSWKGKASNRLEPTMIQEGSIGLKLL